MIRRPPRSTRTDTLFPTRRSSDLVQQARQHSRREGIERHRDDVPEGRYERRSADHAGRACIGGRWLTGGYSSPSDLKLAWPLRPMMTWARTAIPSSLGASRMVRGLWVSSRLGLGSALG